MPPADEVLDPDDVAHVQLARLVSARAVYSHDRDLRGPGLAPPTRAAYDVRLRELAALTQYREIETALGVGLGASAMAVRGAAKVTARLLSLKPAAAAAVLGTATTMVALKALSEPGRRRSMAAVSRQLITHVGEGVQRGNEAGRFLAANAYISRAEPQRLEVQVASHLARTPDQTLTQIGDALGLDRDGRRELSALMRSHVSFERSSPFGWSVGRYRRALETEPPAAPESRTIE